MPPRRPTLSAALLALTLGVAPLPTLAAQVAPRCEGDVVQCVRTRSFDVAVVDFRVSPMQHQRLLTVSLRIRNTLDRPLVLGYVSGSAVALDDQGARYTMNGEQNVRGLGVIGSSRFDPKFTLAPGETSDARLELNWNNSPNQLFGTRFTLELALREIDPVPGNQFRLGREHAFRFTGLADQGVVVADAATPAGAEPQTAPRPVASVDPCVGRERCVATPAFFAVVSQLTAADDRNGTHSLRYRLRIHNTTAQPLVLAYTSRSSIAIDELGQRYDTYNPWEPEARGIGLATYNSLDPQFRLEPGQSREVSFTVSRRIGNTAIGRRFTWDLALQEIQVLNGGQLRSLREHAIGFRDLDAGVAGAIMANDASAQQVQDGVKKIGDAISGILRRRKP